MSFWKCGCECVFDVRITNTQTRTCRNQDPIRVLEKCEWEKKNKHLEACLERRTYFAPLVYSVDGIAAREAKAAKRRLASALAWKWKQQYSETCGFVRVRMALAVVRAYTLLLCGSRVHQSCQRPDIIDGAGMEGWYQFGERY